MEENVMNEKALWNAQGGKMIRKCKTPGRGQGRRQALMTAGAIVGAVLLIGAMVSPLCAQTYPNKPIRFILPFAPGGSFDILGRIIGPKLAERLGQPVVPENRPGAGGNVGAEVTAKARPDGYTILLTGTTISLSPSLYRKLNFDPMKDFTPVSLVSQTPLVVVVKPSLPVKNLKEFVEYARANPGKLNFGSGGIASTPHLAGELLKSLAKIDIVHVPYKGVGPALIGLMGGEVDMVPASASAALPHVQSAKMRALAVLSNERIRSLPNVPTAKEAGIDNFDVTMWYGILAPAGTPRDIVSRLNAEWITIAAIPDTIEKIQKVGFEPMSRTPEQFAGFFRAEIARWSRVIKEANIPTID